jgi:CHAD domain-containing protein
MVDLDPRVPAETALRAYLGEQGRAFLVHLPHMRDGTPGAARSIRAACRRTRAALTTGSSLIVTAWTADIERELGELVRTLTAERDLDVIRGRLGTALEHLPSDPATVRARTMLERILRREYAAAHEAAIGVLSTARFHALADRMALLAEEIPLSSAAAKPCDEVFPALLDAARLSVGRELTRLDESTGIGDPGWERAATATSEARYLAEMCLPVFGERLAVLMDRLERLSDGLGLHHDGALAAVMVERAGQAPRIASGTSFVLGRLAGEQRADIAGVRTTFPALWAAVEALPGHLAGA